MRYQVKWLKGTTTYYGIFVDPATVDPKPAPDHSFVDDAVLPVRYEIETVRLEDLPDIYPSDWDKYVAHRFRLARERSDRLSPGLQKHKFFAVHTIGLAYYLVTRVHGNSVRIEWRAYSLDRWQAPEFGRGGKFPRIRIAQFVTAEEARAELLRKEPV